MAIKSFADKTTAAVFAQVRVKRLSAEVQTVAQRKLAVLNRVVAVEELRVPPGNRLEKLVGDRDDQWSIRINAQWRICFTWSDGGAWDVEIVDYH
jgi:proteic killer suppression protein